MGVAAYLPIRFGQQYDDLQVLSSLQTYRSGGRFTKCDSFSKIFAGIIFGSIVLITAYCLLSKIFRKKDTTDNVNNDPQKSGTDLYAISDAQYPSWKDSMNVLVSYLHKAKDLDQVYIQTNALHLLNSLYYLFGHKDLEPSEDNDNNNNNKDLNEKIFFNECNQILCKDLCNQAVALRTVLLKISDSSGAITEKEIAILQMCPETLRSLEEQIQASRLLQIKMEGELPSQYKDSAFGKMITNMQQKAKNQTKKNKGNIANINALIPVIPRQTALINKYLSRFQELPTINFENTDSLYPKATSLKVILTNTNKELDLNFAQGDNFEIFYDILIYLEKILNNEVLKTNEESFLNDNYETFNAFFQRHNITINDGVR